jgi:nicotinamidase-related amidase
MKKILLRLLMILGAFILIVFLNLVIYSAFATKITKGVPISSSGSGHTALLVIDIQEGTTGTVSVTDSFKERSDVLIRNINRIVSEAHEKGWSVIFIKSEMANPLINLLNNTLARGSEGAKFDKRLTVSSNLVVTKRMSDSFKHTHLDEILTALNTERLVMVGLDAAECVKSTVLAGLNREYRVAVIQEGIIAKEEADKIRAIEEFRDLGVEIIE